MSKKELLEQYKSMTEELPELAAKISRLETGIRKLEQEEVTDSVSCGRHGKKPIRTVKIKGAPVRDITLRKRRLQRRRLEYAMLSRKIEEQTEEAEKIINGIEDSELRRILRMRYLHGMGWKEVAHLMGNGFTEDVCKKRVYRFFEKL